MTAGVTEVTIRNRTETIAKEIAENLESELEQFASIHEDLILKDDLVRS